MNIVGRAGIITVASLFAAGSFVATYAWQPSSSEEPKGLLRWCVYLPCEDLRCCKALAGWLDCAPEQAKQLGGIDASFGEERVNLEAALFTERSRLANMFDSDDATNEGILQQVERVINVDNALERRVAAHLVALRPHLTPEQRVRLYKRCAKGIREASGCQWRHTGQAGREGGPTSIPCEVEHKTAVLE